MRLISTFVLLCLAPVLSFYGCAVTSGSSISGKLIITNGSILALNHSGMSSPPVRDSYAERGIAEPEFVPGEIIVKYKPGVDHLFMTQSVLGSDFHVVGSDRESVRLLRLNSAVQTITHTRNIREMTLLEIERLNSLPYVEYAQPNYIYRALFTPNDQYYDLQWNMPLIKISSGWDDSSFTGTFDVSSVTVAVVDTGIGRYGGDHPDLTGIFRDEYDFISDTAVSGDGNGPDTDATDPPDASGSLFHGTHITGILGALTNNTEGIAGVAGGNNSGIVVMPLRALGSDGVGYDFDIAQAVLHAAGLANAFSAAPARKADIINMSFGTTTPSNYLREAIIQAYNNGVVLVAAAGNKNSDSPFYPAAYPEVISVAALDTGAERAPYSSYGDHVDIAAPGGDRRFDHNFDGYSDGIYSTLFDGVDGFTYGYAQGTSMAASHVSGAAALIVKGLNENPDNPVVSPSTVKDILTGTAINLGNREFFGAGLLNIHAAVSRALGQSETQVPLLHPFPKTVRFESRKSSGSFSLLNIGNNDSITINRGGIAVSHDPEGLIAEIFPTSGTVDSGGLKIHITLNTGGLDNGSTHAALIEVTDSAGRREDVSIVYKYIGKVYIVAWHPDDFPRSLPVPMDHTGIVATTVTDYEKGYNYRIELPGAGEYVLGASTDRDEDGLLFEPLGEVCGFYPALEYANIMELKNDQHIGGIEFHVFDPKL